MGRSIRAPPETAGLAAGPLVTAQEVSRRAHDFGSNRLQVAHFQPVDISNGRLFQYEKIPRHLQSRLIERNYLPKSEKTFSIFRRAVS
jgi:hypothetical protein